MKQQYNYELFEKILKHIIEYPQSFNVSTWKETTECGTTMCIAGLACYLSNLDIPDFRTYSVSAMSNWVSDKAGTLLNINIDEATSLFYIEEEELAIDVLSEIVSDKNEEKQRSIEYIIDYVNKEYELAELW